MGDPTRFPEGMPASAPAIQKKKSIYLPPGWPEGKECPAPGADFPITLSWDNWREPYMRPVIIQECLSGMTVSLAMVRQVLAGVVSTVLPSAQPAPAHQPLNPLRPRRLPPQVPEAVAFRSVGLPRRSACSTAHPIRANARHAPTNTRTTAICMAASPPA